MRADVVAATSASPIAYEMPLHFQKGITTLLKNSKSFAGCSGPPLALAENWDEHKDLSGWYVLGYVLLTRPGGCRRRWMVYVLFGMANGCCPRRATELKHLTSSYSDFLAM